MNVEEIKEACRYAKSAYRDQDDLKNIFQDDITIIDPMIKGFGDACYIIHESKRVIIMFPGSKDIKDWVLNLAFDEKNGFHEGFQHDLDRMEDQIIDKIKSLETDSILITGHSRGGALADLLFEKFRNEFPCPVDCITFAQPKIVTERYYNTSISSKDTPGARYLRVYTANDPVPDLPPKKFGYTHRGDSMMLGEPLSWWQKIVRLWKLHRDGKKLTLATIEAHSIERYSELVERL